MRSTPRSLRAWQPIWLKRSSLKQRYAALDGRRDAEIAIVGGGITGALVAHAFATAGVSTVLLEKALVGSGSTAASSALLLQEPELSLVELERRYGVRTSRRIWRLSHEGVSDLLRLLRRLRILVD